jgi:hypothetical protein
VGVWVQPCRLNVTTDGFTVVLKDLPGEKNRSPLQHGCCSWFYAPRALELSRAGRDECGRPKWTGLVLTITAGNPLVKPLAAKLTYIFRPRYIGAKFAQLPGGPIRDRARWHFPRRRRGPAMRSRIAGGLLRCLVVATCRRTGRWTSWVAAVSTLKQFPLFLLRKVPQAPVSTEDQFSRVRVRPETRTERPKAGQDGFSSLTFTRSHWRVAGALFWR